MELNVMMMARMIFVWKEYVLQLVVIKGLDQMQLKTDAVYVGEMEVRVKIFEEYMMSKIWELDIRT